MRLIDADILQKSLREEINDFGAEEDKECFKYASAIVNQVPTAKAIPIDWLHKELIDLLYDGVSGEGVNKVFYRVLAKWEKWEEENEKDNS